MPLRVCLIPFLVLCTCLASAQQVQRCAAMERLKLKFDASEFLKLHFEQERELFNQLIQKRLFPHREDAAGLPGEVVTIPVVVHIVLTDPGVVSDEMIHLQLGVLNKAFSGTAEDSSRVPEYFKPLTGRSVIRFCLARQSPDGLPVTGINRVVTSRRSFSASNEGVKHTASGGVDSWNTSRYLNIWITTLSDGILGYSSFPEDGSPGEQGVVIDYRSLPGGALTRYNNGKTLVHETGHFFNLYHIWGDDDGRCTGTDYVEDTPPQAGATSNCTEGKVFDNCTPSGDGIMYQNYMDYTDDNCLVMFTQQQVERMEAAVSAYFASLTHSDACQEPQLNTNDAAVVQIKSPSRRICSPSFTTSIVIENRGRELLSALQVITILDDRIVDSLQWTGELSYRETAEISTGTFRVEEGSHRLTFMTVLPNGRTDEHVADDTLSVIVHFFGARDQLDEGFEEGAWPAGWDEETVSGTDHWVVVQGVSASGGNAAALVSSSVAGSSASLLRLPELNLQQIDSAWLSFSYRGSDTLALLASTDCGHQYTSLYNSVSRRIQLNQSVNTEQWVRDSVNLSGYIDAGNLMLAFKSSLPESRSIHLDDIFLRTVTVNPNLKLSGFLVTPNPASSVLTVQFYPQPANLRSISLYAISGQKVREINASSQSSIYTIDISALPPGVYVVSVRFADRAVQRKIIKMR